LLRFQPPGLDGGGGGGGTGQLQPAQAGFAPLVAAVRTQFAINRPVSTVSTAGSG